MPNPKLSSQAIEMLARIAMQDRTVRPEVIWIEHFRMLLLAFSRVSRPRS